MTTPQAWTGNAETHHRAGGFVPISDEEHQAFQDERQQAAMKAVEEVMRRHGYMGPIAADNPWFQEEMGARLASMRSAANPHLSGMGWNNPQQAAAAQAAFERYGYDGLRQMGYDVPEDFKQEYTLPTLEEYLPLGGEDRVALARFLMSPEQYQLMQYQRDADLLGAVFDDEMQFRTPEELGAAVRYYNRSRGNPFTHADYGDPNYSLFEKPAMGGVENFFGDPQSPVSNAMSGMEVTTDLLLNMGDADQPDMPRRYGEAAERAMASRQFRDLFKKGDAPIMDLQPDATPEDRIRRNRELAGLRQDVRAATGQEALAGVGVPDKYNTPLAGAGAELVASIPDATFMAEPFHSRNLKAELFWDAVTDAGINLGLSTGMAGSDHRTWKDFATKAYEPPTAEQARASDNNRTRMSATTMGRLPFANTFGDSWQARARQASKQEDGIRQLQGMFNAPFDPSGPPKAYVAPKPPAVRFIPTFR